MDRRKVLIVFAGAWISAALLTWLLYRATQAPRAEQTVSILAAARDMPAGTRLQKSDIRRVRVPQKDAPKAALTDEKQVLDRPLLFPIGANEPITPMKIASAAGAEGLPATIDVGMRAIAVQVNDTSGVAGLIQPRAHVDVLFTRIGSMAEAVTSTILEDVVVLAIGRVTEVSPAPATPAATTQVNTQTNVNRSATLLVTPEQARVLELAKNQGRISLALRNPLDRSTSDTRAATTADELYSKLPPGRRPGVKTKAPPRVEAKAEPPPPPPPPPPPVEPPKPKTVVDVYRGDKHVQEQF